MTSANSSSRLKVCAVSYLNTVPLVWGMLHGAQKGLFDLLFRVPAICADMVNGGQADLGIIPSFELIGRDLGIIPGLGICCQSAVRSILLISKVPAAEIRSLAADSSSRTSVALTRIILARRYGVEPTLVRRPPELAAMLGEADSALIIGDPALRIDPEKLPFHVYDLGEEWLQMTGLPMVFAVWAGNRECITPDVIAAFQDSYAAGQRDMERIVAEESVRLHFPPDLVRRYLASNVTFDLGPREQEGMRLFLDYARQLPAPTAALVRC